MKIPTIFRGDDAGAITLTLDSAHTYDGATLVVAYQGVTKTFTGLAAGGTVSLVYTHGETAGFALGCHPVEARLVGASGGVETVSNAEWRIKVTDILAEVNCGGSFSVAPGAATVPVTDIDGMGEHYRLSDLAAKVDEICRVLAQRTALALAAALAALCASGASVQTERLDALYNDAQVVTSVTFDPAPDFTTNNVVLTNTIAKVAPAPDFTTNNVVLTNTIAKVAPVPGDYTTLTNKPSINNVTLSGNKTSANLGLLGLAGGTMTGTLAFNPSVRLPIYIAGDGPDSYAAILNRDSLQISGISNSGGNEERFIILTPYVLQIYNPSYELVAELTFPATSGTLALTSQLHPLSGHNYNFETNEGLYAAVRDMILALGGSVTNFPALPSEQQNQ